MPVCLKCGWEIIIGPGGCACTQTARRERSMQKAARSSEVLMTKLGPELEKLKKQWARREKKAGKKR